MAVVLLVQVLAAFALIPQFGALGAAIGILLAMFVGLLLTAFVGWKAGYRYPIPQSLLKTVIATAGMALAILVIQPFLGQINNVLALIISIGIAFAVYGLAHLLLNSFEVRSSLLKLRSRQGAV